MGRFSLQPDYAGTIDDVLVSVRPIGDGRYAFTAQVNWWTGTRIEPGFAEGEARLAEDGDDVLFDWYVRPDDDTAEDWIMEEVAEQVRELERELQQ